jgi:hypothetical protein
VTQLHARHRWGSGFVARKAERMVRPLPDDESSERAWRDEGGLSSGNPSHASQQLPKARLRESQVRSAPATAPAAEIQQSAVAPVWDLGAEDEIGSRAGSRDAPESPHSKRMQEVSYTVCRSFESSRGGIGHRAKCARLAGFPLLSTVPDVSKRQQASRCWVGSGQDSVKDDDRVLYPPEDLPHALCVLHASFQGMSPAPGSTCSVSGRPRKLTSQRRS